MPSKLRVLALDVGSSSVKVALWDGKKFVAHARVAYATEFSGNRVEIPAGRILKAVMEAGREVLRGGKQIDAVSFCALSSAVVVTDAQGEVRVGAITHQDRRSVEEAKTLVEKFGHKWFLERLGNLPYPGGIGSSTLAWIHRHARGALRGKYRVGQMSSVIGQLLTGEWVIDPSQAVFLGLWDIGAKKWNAEICKAVGVDVAALPRVQWADESVGGLTAAIARKWGVTSGVPVVGGFVDTSAAILSSPMKAGQLAHNSGSTDVLAMCLDEARPAVGILSRPVGVGKVFKEKWLAVRTIAASGSALAWARETLFSDVSEAGWKKLLHAACKKGEEKGNLLCIPTFAGDRAAIDQRTGAAFLGVTLSTKREDFLATIVGGLVQMSKLNYDMLAKVHRPAKTVYAMGSGVDLARAMHAVWSGKHTFERIEGDSLEGLVLLAEKSVALQRR